MSHQKMPVKSRIIIAKHARIMYDNTDGFIEPISKDHLYSGGNIYYEKENTLFTYDSRADSGRLFPKSRYSG